MSSKKSKRTQFDDLIVNFTEIKNQIESSGQCMENISINGSIMWTLNDEILKLIQRYCKPKQLRLFCFQINKSTVPILALVLQSVVKFELIYCPITINRFDQLFENCDNLESLSIINPNAVIDSKFFTKKFRNLMKFHLVIEKLSDTNLMATFIKDHPDLKRFVYLPQNDSTKKITTWFNQVKKLPTNLEEFGIMMSENDVDHHIELLSKLNGLQRIQIECNNIEESMGALFEELAEHKSLEVLSIWKPKFSVKFCKAVAKMTNLKTLELRQFSDTDEIKKMINSNMTKKMKLENLYLDDTSIKSSNDLTFLLENFENLQNLQNLYLCDVKNVFLLQEANKLDSWYSKISPTIQIFINSSCILQLKNKTKNASTEIIDDVFIPFKDRMSQMFNVLIET